MTSRSCTMANLFGVGYADKSSAIKSDHKYKGITWESFRGPTHSLKRLVMKVRPANFSAESKVMKELFLYIYAKSNSYWQLTRLW